MRWLLVDGGFGLIILFLHTSGSGLLVVGDYQIRRSPSASWSIRILELWFSNPLEHVLPLCPNFGLHKNGLGVDICSCMYHQSIIPWITKMIIVLCMLTE